MPIYEYVCPACGREFERLVRAWNEAVSCPACQETDVEKQISTFAMAGSSPGASASASGGCGCGRGGCGCGH